MPHDMVWTILPATERLRSDDPLLAHKTTRRDAYDRARAEAAAAGADEAILCNERGELCEGAFTSLFLRRAETLLTPPLACGLLPGILRAELLEAGRAREAVLTLDDLEGAEAIYMGNSLRGLIRARLPAS